ncbi:hypothetical protein [Ferrovibrio xuzhouensis]|uniref:Cysteine dioxygenase type I n=1 Tax=Ferrovibrio xuzhouensis TaxID=1576914 RepID=A0ABV7VC55_9PROT
MKLPDRFITALHKRLETVSASRDPDIIIGGNDKPYLKRWYVIPRNRWLNVYLHQFLRSDDDRALHDHPWVNCSILLANEYTEVLPTIGATTTSRILRPGSVVFRRPRAAHRVLLHAGPAVTLFLTGPRIREWGFWCPQGWRHWEDFTAGHRGEIVGKGCE